MIQLLATFVIIIFWNNLLISVNANEQIPFRLFSATLMTQAPKINGKVDDPCWQKLSIMDRFTCVLTKQGVT